MLCSFGWWQYSAGKRLRVAVANPQRICKRCWVIVKAPPSWVLFLRSVICWCCGAVLDYSISFLNPSVMLSMIALPKSTTPSISPIAGRVVGVGSGCEVLLHPSNMKLVSAITAISDFIIQVG